jgi:putative oxygen-independent coproporphyrinogen III oxidase
MIGPGALYVHFPWCVRKCPYCDFNSHAMHGTLDEAGYLAALERDALCALADLPHGSIGTVFFGGGTPSLFAPESFARLLDMLRPWLAHDPEITMEANPGAAEHHAFEAYRRAGINRLSLGAQSFDDRFLAKLGRIHTSADTLTAFARARSAGFDNINLDLMYGLPGQTVAGARDDLEAAVHLAPEHVSWYQLTIERGTEFAVRRPRLPGDVAVERMEREGHAVLDAQGYARYEVSAFARTGRASRHNLNYWNFGDYVGIGAGAHGKRTSGSGAALEIVRTRKRPQPRRYLAEPLAVERVPVTRGERPVEFLMNALRLKEGTAFERFEVCTGLPFETIAERWSALCDRSLVRPDRIAATPRGYRHLDAVLQDFLK